MKIVFFLVNVLASYVNFLSLLCRWFSCADDSNYTFSQVQNLMSSLLLLCLLHVRVLGVLS